MVITARVTLGVREGVHVFDGWNPATLRQRWQRDAIVTIDPITCRPLVSPRVPDCTPDEWLRIARTPADRPLGLLAALTWAAYFIRREAEACPTLGHLLDRCAVPGARLVGLLRVGSIARTRWHVN